MSSQLYKAAAGAEMFGAIIYACAAAFSLVMLIIHWGAALAPMLAVAGIVASRLSWAHLKERNSLLKDAAEIDNQELEPTENE
jgi:hypothetical protein